MIIIVFSGCSGRTKMPDIVTKQQMNNTIKPNQSNSKVMTELYSKTLKELVTAKTITKTQSSKVLAAITNNMTPNTVTVPNTVTAPDAITTPNTVTTPNGVKAPNSITTSNGVTAPNTVTSPNTVMTPDTTPIINKIKLYVRVVKK